MNSQKRKDMDTLLDSLTDRNTKSFRLLAVTLEIQVLDISIGAKFSFSILYCSNKIQVLTKDRETIQHINKKQFSGVS